MEKVEKLVPDTSILIEGLISEKIQQKELIFDEIIIHEAVLAELEHQANLGRAIGYLGLDELEKIWNLAAESKFQIRYAGRRPKMVEIKYASMGEIDSMIRDLAWEMDATLLSADKVQARIAKAKGMKVIYIEPKEKETKKLKLDKFFDKTTMSAHLRENVKPKAKKGVPGKWVFEVIRKEVMEQDEIKEISKEIIESAKLRKDSFIEIQREGSTIVQLGQYRIVITRPPFSDGWEITAVKPIKKLSLEEYKLSDKLKKRVAEQAEGILIAGAPGQGKSTFASALAEYYAFKEKVVKTIEAPRDLILPEEITQYAISHGDAQEIHDILLLSRPDYTIFDEMRNTNDFKLFADLRLSGIGLVGVLHATNPVDAIQRFVGRIELGVIPQVIDTVVFIKNGGIDKVLSLTMTVKVPSGMTEADLARPVVEVKDFETNNLEFEIYSYGEETVVVPVKASSRKSSVHGLAAKQIEKVLRNLSDDVEAEVISDNKAIIYVPERDIGKVIGKQGKTIEEIEQKLGINIEVREKQEKPMEEGKEVEYHLNENHSYIRFYVNETNTNIDFLINDQFLFTATSSKKGEIKVHKKSKLGRTLAEAIKMRKKITLKTSEK
ncbi:MAG: PINc/VapC family ATPase [Candidatus Nanoarchaeia archaeon]